MLSILSSGGNRILQDSFRDIVDIPQDSGTNAQTIFHYKKLTYAPSWHCDASCSHCLLPSAKRREDCFSNAVLSRLLLDRPEKLEHIELTGGEPFLHPLRLSTLVKKLSESGWKVSVITGGTWLRDMVEIRELVSRLAGSGLKYLTLSMDDYHKPQVRKTDAIRLITSLKEVGIGVSIACIGQKSRATIFELLNEQIIDESADRISIRALERVGGALQFPKKSFSNKEPDRCKNLFSPLVAPDGKMLACCSTRLLEFSNRFHIIGSLKKSSLGQILTRSSSSILICALMSFGPRNIYDMIGEEAPKGLSKCALCVRFMNRPEFMRRLEDRLWEDKSLKKEIAGRTMLMSCQE